MARHVVVTGGGGFVGQWLGRALLARGDEVWLTGIGARPDGPTLDSREWAAVRWAEMDVRAAAQVDAVFKAARPDLVVHLAGVSFVPAAERDPVAAYEINMLGGTRVTFAASALREAGVADPVVLLVGSGTQYGDHPPEAMPLTEEAPQRPRTTYAASKAAQELAGLQIGRATGLRVIAARSFNHSGPGQAPNFLLPALVAQARKVRDAGGPIRLGNDAVRDFLHVEDVATAYLALAERGVPGEPYNVCSGVGVSTRTLAEATARLAGLDAGIERDPKLERANDTPVLVGSPHKLSAATGWAPRKTHLDIIADLLAAPERGV
jgi:GDP-4-dehydro-6-deoxy-D-mannose reductase